MTATLTPVTSINASSNDYVTPNGHRISSPLYLDLTIQERKALLSAARELSTRFELQQVPSKSGISVATTTSTLSALESYLGMSFSNLRGVLFQRGGVSIDLILKLQEATKYQVVSLKEIETALKTKAGIVKDFLQANPFNG